MKSKKDNTNTILIAYVPAPHAGYLKFFRAYEGTILFVLGEEFIREHQPLVRHLPGVSPEEAVMMIQVLDIFLDVCVLTKRCLTELDIVQSASRIVMPDEDVSHAFAESYLTRFDNLPPITFDGRWRLRWDWGATQLKRRPENERVVSKEILDQHFMRNAFALAEKSPDWWRQIGALLVRDGRTLLVALNRHVPSEQSEYCYGDPRSNFEQGQSIEVSGAMHAEVGLIAEAANRGISMKGCDLYVTTFPCPPCAGPCAYSGIKRLFYADGYSLVAGAETLESQGVEIIRVEM